MGLNGLEICLLAVLKGLAPQVLTAVQLLREGRDLILEVLVKTRIVVTALSRIFSS